MAFAAVCFSLTFVELFVSSPNDKDDDDDDADDKLNSDPDEEVLASEFFKWIRCMWLKSSSIDFLGGKGGN